MHQKWSPKTTATNLGKKKKLAISWRRTATLVAWSSNMPDLITYIEVMHERNAHNFPLDLATGDQLIALKVPAIAG